MGEIFLKNNFRGCDKSPVEDNSLRGFIVNTERETSKNIQVVKRDKKQRITYDQAW